MVNSWDKHNDKNQTVRILVVEDNPDYCSQLTWFLKPFGSRYDLHCEAALKDALNRLRSDEAFDVVLLDLQIVDVSLQQGQQGHSLKKIHEVRPDLPVIVMTELDDEEVACRLLMQGAAAFVTKQSLFGDGISREIESALLWVCCTQPSGAATDGPSCAVVDRREVPSRERRGRIQYSLAVSPFSALFK